MRVLIVSGNYLPISPVGPAYVGGAALKEGHSVKVFDCLIDGHDMERLETRLKSFQPDVIGLSIPMTTVQAKDRIFEIQPELPDTRPLLKQLVTVAKRKSRAVILVGGGGFNSFSEDWLEFLGLEQGLIGESEETFPLFLAALQRKGPVTGIPGLVVKSGKRLIKEPLRRVMQLNATSMPAYELFDIDPYNRLGVPWGISTKKGCSFDCSYCCNRLIEGRQYRGKSPARVIEEIKYVMRVTGSDRINFSDNSFNCPITHAKSICRAIIDSGLKVQWRSGTFKPLGFSREFCDLLEQSGCSYVGLAMETGSPRMLANQNRGYRVEDIRLTLDNLSASGMDFGVSLLIGAPGETMTSIKETLKIVDGYPQLKAVWVNIGVFGWQHRSPVRQGGSRLFQDAYYISPELGQEDMVDLIDDLSERQNFLVQVNKPWASYVSH